MHSHTIEGQGGKSARRGVEQVSSTASKRERSAHQPTGCWIRPAKRLAIYLRDGFTCAYCGRDLHNVAPADITLDHLTPKSEGGSNKEENLVTACRSCNSARGAKSWTDYAPGGAIERIVAQIEKALDMDLARALIAGTTGDATVEVR
jgi:hypothetical protein